MTPRASGHFPARAAGLRPLVLVCALLTACAMNPSAAHESAPADDIGRKQLRVLTTNDFHGNLEPIYPNWADGRAVGGAATLITYFARERAAFAGPTVLLDGGDIMQGTPVSNLTRGRSTVEYYNRAGYDGAAIGNHEFDWGPLVLRERMAQAQFPWLAANILVAGSDTTPSWLRGTALIERAGVRIGLIGLITQETPTATMPEHVAGLTFADGATTIDRHVPRLRAAGVDFVIVVAHAGAHCDDETNACTDEMIEWLQRVQHKPDLVVGGHIHEPVRVRVNGVTLIQAGSWGQRYGIVDLERVRADSVAVHIRGLRVAWADSVQPDHDIAALVERTAREVAPQLDRVIATAADSIVRRGREHAMGRLIADAQRAKTGAQIAFMNNGGIRANVDAGPLTWGELYRVQPFGNKLMLLRVRGADVRAALEYALSRNNPGAHVSGLEVVYDSLLSVGQRVVSARLASGAELRDDAVYTVTVSDFMFTGGDGYDMFARALESHATGIIDLDALIEYIQTLPQPVRPPMDVRMRALRRERQH